MSRPLALSVDLDDTLSDSEGTLDAVRRSCDRISQVTVLDSSVVFETNVSVFRDLFPTMEFDWVMGEISDRELRYEVWSETFRKLGISDEALLEEALSVFTTALPLCLRLYDDVPQFFAAVEGIPCVLLTNGAAVSQREKVEALGIEGYFEAVVIAGEVGVMKPNPEMFMVAANRLEVPVRHMWHLGDSLMADVAGAKAAGCRSVWVNRDGRTLESSDPQPDEAVSSLADLRIH